MMMSNNDALKVPDGWRIQNDIYGRDCSIVTSPAHCMATIDWERRGFRAGITTIGSFKNKRSAAFIGRGWKQKLVNAAVAWLRKLG